MKNRKRILAAILTAIMTISILPANSFASEAGENDTAEAAVEAVSVSDEEQEVESTVEDISEETAEETEESSSETVQTDEEADPAAAEEVGTDNEDVETTIEEDAEADYTVEAEETAEEEEAVPAETVEWPVTLQVKDGDYNVTVTYGEEAGLPADAKISVEEILASDKAYDGYVEQAADTIAADVDAISYVKLLDIKLIDRNGNKLEPNGFVDVKIRLKDVGQVEESTQVVHFAGEEETPEILDADISGKDVSFETDGFSIYALITAGDDEEPKILTVNFYGSDQSEPLETVYVKEADKTNGQLEKIVYDPGAGEIPAGRAFYGWSTEADYSVEEPGKTIEQIREDIIGLDFDTVDDHTLNLYAMFVTYYTVKYIDPEGLNLGTDRAMVKAPGDQAVYRVNKGYSTDSTHNFEGWHIANGISNIVVPANPTPETLLTNGTDITITGNVELSVSAPEGHWLVFNENGKHATYNAPRFVKDGEVTTDENMLEMVRNGYTFEGWFYGAPETEGGDPTGEPFEFNHELTDNTTVYAKWAPLSSANYTVIIWKEGLKQGTWDFAEAMTLSGTPNTTINTISVQGSGNGTYARIDSTNYQYEGFRYDHHDTGVTINPEGDSVVNVYYMRNIYTLTFQTSFSLFGYHFTFREITARYGEDISSYFPIQTSQGFGPFTNAIASWFNSLVRWEPQGSSTYNRPVVYIDTMPAESITFYTDRSLSSQKEMYYYVEALPGQTPERSYNGKQFVLLAGPLGARYNFFTEDEDFLEISGYERFGSEPQFNAQGQADGDTLRCYYTRQLETINYLNGAEYDGNNRMMELLSGQLGTQSGIPYGSDISSYNVGQPNALEIPERDGFVFEGWFIDRTCTSPYEFDTMPNGGITVYAKWRQIEYRVFLRPNADEDTTLNWGSDQQATNFRVTYGEKISAPEGTRRGYKFLGWYTDPGCKNYFYAPGVVLNDNTVTDTYVKTESAYMTDPSNKWGNQNATQNADVNRFWITRKLDLYALWGQVVIGADGIGVLYDPANDGAEFSDPAVYQDNTTAVASAAPTAPEGQVFTNWTVQRWNGSAYEDTDVTVLPGQTFTVKLDDSRVQDADNEYADISLDDVVESGHYRYTIKLVAQYKEVEEVVPTHITWYKNDGSGEFYRDDQGIKINQLMPVYGLGEGEEIPEWEGHTFLGWAKDTEQIQGQETMNTSTTKTTPDFLQYNAEDGKYYSDGKEVTQVLADELTPIEGLYAVWEEKNVYFIYHDYVGGEAKSYLEECPMPANGATVNLPKDKVTDGYLYGGYWNYTNKEKGTQITDVPGTQFAPHKQQYIYIKEVSKDYLKPQVYLVYSKDHFGLVRKLYGFNDLDTQYADYTDAGLIVDGTEYQIFGPDKLTDGTITVKKGTGNTSLSSKNLFGFTGAVIGYADLTSHVAITEEPIAIKGYYVTKDGIKVTGYYTRRIQFADYNETYQLPVFKGWEGTTGWSGEDGNTLCDLVLGAPAYTAVSRMAAPKFTLMRSLSITAPAEKFDFTITKVFDPGVELQTVSEGNHTGEITYAEKSGYYFAGWYKDSAFTEPADFSNVTCDLTVYAKYVKAGNVSTSFNRKSSKSGTTTFNAVVAVKDKSDLTNVSITVDGSDASALGNGSVKKTGSGKNIKYTTQYKGTAAVKGLSLIDTFTAVISWTTADGTVVTGPAYNCTYILGLVTVR